MKITFALAQFVAAVLLTFVVSATPSGADAAPAIWGGLQAGPHTVGFRGWFEADRSRSFFRKRDYLGHTSGYSGERLVRIALWYPARPATGKPMQFRDYVTYPAAGKDAQALERILELQDLGSPTGGGVQGVVRAISGGFQSLMALTMAAHRDATPEEGRFPLIVYSLGQNDYTQENIVLWEYLASHGYVVVTVPDLGTSPRRESLWIYEPTSFEVQLRDLEFALTTVVREPCVDGQHVAAVGHSMGGTYALLLAMRNPSIDAVAGLDASLMSKREDYEFDMASAPYFDPSVVRIPIFQQFRGNDSFTPIVTDKLIYADRFLLRYENLTHGDFQSAPLYTGAIAPTWGDPGEIAIRSPQAARAGYRQVVERLKTFLDWSLKGEGDFPRAFSKMQSGVPVPTAVMRSDGLDVPNAEEFFEIERTQGLEKTLRLYRELSARAGGKPLFSEAEIVRIINESVYGDHNDRALAMAELYAAAYPQSKEALVKLARAHERLGQKPQAAQAYRRATVLDPSDEKLRSKLKEMLLP